MENNNNTYEICSVPIYKINYDNCKKINKTIDEIKSTLHCDLQFHERLHKDDLLKVFVDIDSLSEKNKNNKTIHDVFNEICEFFDIQHHELSYTTNFYVSSGSHHIVIPKYFMISSKQKIIWESFKNKYGYGNEIDSGIFDKDIWFRLPNQTKEKKENTQHIIQQGNLEDFVLKYIPDTCIQFIPNDELEEEIKKKKEKKNNKNQNEKKNNNTLSYCFTLSKTKKMKKEIKSLIGILGFKSLGL